MLTKFQKKLIDDFLSFPMDEINELKNPKDRIKVLSAIKEKSFTTKTRTFLHKKNILEVVEQIQAILLHKNPQNRYVGDPSAASNKPDGILNGKVYYWKNGFASTVLSEDRGLLGLTARGNDEKSPATADDVHQYVNQQIDIAIAKLKVIAELKSTFQLFKSNRNDLDILLGFVLKNKINEANYIIRTNPSLLFVKNKITDSLDRTIEGSAFQLALITGNVPMLKMMERYFGEIENSQEALKQFKKVFPKDIEFTSSTYDFSSLAKAISEDKLLFESQITEETKLELNKFKDYFMPPKNTIKTAAYFDNILINYHHAQTILENYKYLWEYPKQSFFAENILKSLQKLMPASYSQKSYSSNLRILIEEKNRFLYELKHQLEPSSHQTKLKW